MENTDRRPPKRRKVDLQKERPRPDIRGAFELHDLLRFKQNTIPEVKAGIDTFKEFLTAIQKSDDPAEKEIQLKVLKQYCDDQSSSTKNDTDFPDLLSTWSFAAQSNAEPVLSAVPATLAQFFRTISTELDFRDFGVSLCHTLLKQDQLRLIDGGLSAPKFKEFLISPCLRLLTEIVSFDGGSLSSNVFARREILLRRLDTLLDTVPSHQDSADRRRPTVRRNAERLLLALLKYLDPESKAELVGHGKAIYSCLRRLSLDGGDIIRELLDSFRQQILKADLPKQLKNRFLSSGNLSQLAALYDFEPEEVDSEADGQRTPSVREDIHKFLLQACTTQDGALLQQSGWYPSGFDFEASISTNEDSIDLGLDSPYYFDEYESAVPVRNANLSAFLQSLRPDKDTLQAELLVAIFDAAPELVADYFTKRPRFTSRPNDDAAWRGQVAFIFSVIILPVPHNCGAQDQIAALPPPLSVVVESILPRPMNRSAIVQSLNSTDEVMALSAARLMTQALKKLDKVQNLFQSAHLSSDTWDQACQKLCESVAARAPIYQDFVTALQKAPEAHVQARFAISECMVMYNQILPMSTAVSKFDAGPLLLEAIGQFTFKETTEEDDLASHVTNLAELGRLSQTMRWWHKSKPDQLSPLIRLIKVYVTKGYLVADHTIKDIIYEVIHKAGIVRPEATAADALVCSFYGRPAGEDSVPLPLHVYLFAENCMIRTSKQPVKYLDQLEEAQREVSDDTPLSLLPICVAEQWPYVLKTSDLDMVKDLAKWVARLFALLDASGENEAVLGNYLRKQMCDESTKEAKESLLYAFSDEDDHPGHLPRLIRKLPSSGTFKIPAERQPTSDGADKEKLPTADASPSAALVDLYSLFPSAAPPPSSLKGLTNWANPEFDSELTPPIANSRIGRLIHCLSSPLEEIRLQALHMIQSIMHTLSTSNYAEKDQAYLLLGELCETARQHALTASTPSQPPSHHHLNKGDPSKKREKDPALPSIITSLATLLLAILTNPADKMYSKTNRFLMRGPTWTPVTRIIPYWIDQVLLQEPEIDEPNAWETEVNRLLDVLANGMRTEQDLDVYRRSVVFERAGSLYMSPALAGKLGMRKKMLHVFANAIEVDGGADTLITRVGIRSWLEMVGARESNDSEMGKVADALKARLEEKCSKEYIKQWEDDRPIFRQKATK